MKTHTEHWGRMNNSITILSMKSVSIAATAILFFFLTDTGCALDHIAASQLGFAPGMKKQFSSPVQFTSFEIRRVADDGIVFTGGAPIGQITSSLIGGATVWIGDFTTLTTPGRYKIVVGTTESYPFTIGTNIFDQPLRAVQRFFYYQRAFTAIEMPYAEGPWIHPTDVDKAPPGVVKGWHDAGNYAIYMPTMTQSVFWLLEAWSDFRPMDDDTNIPESGNTIPDLLDEARWGAEWVKSMQDSGGGFWGTSCPGCNELYPYGSSTPNTISPYCKSLPPTVQNTAKAVAVLAYASKVFSEFDTAFASSCLASAQAGWSWMANNPTETNDAGPCGGSYLQGSDPALLKTNRMWAAASMLYATGNPLYETAFQNEYVTINGISSYSKSEAFAASVYLRITAGANPVTMNSIRQQFFSMANGVRSDADAHPFQFATAYYWGCTSNGMHRSGQFSWKAYALDSTRTSDRDQASMNLDYIFGRNYLNLCYISGIDSISKSRERGFHEWMKALNTTPWHFPGALGGGPNQSPDANDISYPSMLPYPIWGYWGDTANPRNASTPVDGRFTDNDSWSTNEIAINWNAALLYNLYAAKKIAKGGNPTGVIPNPSKTPSSFKLHQNYPNPFNNSSLIEYEVSIESQVTIGVYDEIGKLISTLVDRHQPPGTSRVQFDATTIPSGVYYYRLRAGRFSTTKKMVLLK